MSESTRKVWLDPKTTAFVALEADVMTPAQAKSFGRNYLTLKVADCADVAELDFGFGTEPERKQRLAKLERLERMLAGLRATIVAAPVRQPRK